MSVTTTESKTTPGKYPQTAMFEDVSFTRYGEVIAKPTNPCQDRVDVAESLLGILPQTMTMEEAMDERLSDV